MAWNYRVICNLKTMTYMLGKVFYDGQENPVTWTTEPIGFSGEDRDEIVRDLAIALIDAIARDVLYVSGDKVLKKFIPPDDDDAEATDEQLAQAKSFTEAFPTIADAMRKRSSSPE